MKMIEFNFSHPDYSGIDTKRTWYVLVIKSINEECNNGTFYDGFIKKMNYSFTSKKFMFDEFIDQYQSLLEYTDCGIITLEGFTYRELTESYNRELDRKLGCGRLFGSTNIYQAEISVLGEIVYITDDMFDELVTLAEDLSQVYYDEYIPIIQSCMIFIKECRKFIYDNPNMEILYKLLNRLKYYPLFFIVLDNCDFENTDDKHWYSNLDEKIIRHLKEAKFDNELEDYANTNLLQNDLISYLRMLQCFNDELKY